VFIKTNNSTKSVAAVHCEKFSQYSIKLYSKVNSDHDDAKRFY